MTDSSQLDKRSAWNGKWCAYCMKDTHTDAECWSTRPADWHPGRNLPYIWPERAPASSSLAKPDSELTAHMLLWECLPHLSDGLKKRVSSFINESPALPSVVACSDSIPHGYALVPIEPTAAMIDAATHCLDGKNLHKEARPATCTSRCATKAEIRTYKACHRWWAMLAARPAPTDSIPAATPLTDSERTSYDARILELGMERNRLERELAEMRRQRDNAQTNHGVTLEELDAARSASSAITHNEIAAPQGGGSQSADESTERGKGHARVPPSEPPISTVPAVAASSASPTIGRVECCYGSKLQESCVLRCAHVKPSLWPLIKELDEAYKAAGIAVNGGGLTLATWITEMREQCLAPSAKPRGESDAG